METRRVVRPLVPLIVLATLALRHPGAQAFDVVLNAQNEFLDAYLVNGSGIPPRVVFDDPDPADPSSLTVAPRGGRHLNGKVCFFPRRTGHRGQFLIADDTYREACLDSHPPQARCAVTRRRSPFFVGHDPDGWGVFKRNGTWTRRHIHTPWDFSSPQPQGNIDPQGCVFDAAGRLFVNDVGHGAAREPDGSLIVFFPGRDKRYSTYCFLDKALSAPGMPVMDDAGNIYVPEPGAAKITTFSPPFPSHPSDCDNPNHLVATPPTKTVFFPVPGRDTGGLTIPISMVRVPNTDHWYIDGVILPPIINEYDRDAVFVRNIVPAGVPKNPIGMDVGSDGTLYYAEVNIDLVTLDTRCGSMSMVKFDANGQPQPPQTIGRTLQFPDGVTVVDSSRFAVDFTKLPPAVDLDPSACGGE
jgi:hypothetical protein